MKNGFKLAIKIHSCGLQLHAEHAASGHRFKSPKWQYNLSVYLSVCPSSCPQDFCGFMSIWLVVRGPFWTRTNASRRRTPLMEIIENTFTFCGSIIVMHLSPKLGSSPAYLSIFLSVCRVICVAFWNWFVCPVEFKLTEFINFLNHFFVNHRKIK